MRQLIPTGHPTNDNVQTPNELAEILIYHFNPRGRILEPCCGDGAFLKYLPEGTEWCEISKGKDFMDWPDERKVNWIITNPPWSKMRVFMNKSMKVADNVVFLATINHLWLKARIRDIEEAGFGIKEILIFDSPKSFPQSGFQVGCFYLQRGYNGPIEFSRLK